MELDLSMVSEDDDFQGYNTDEGKPVHTSIEGELQLLPKETPLTPETEKNNRRKTFTEPHQTVRRSKRLHFAKQTGKLGGVPYYTDNKKENE